MVLIRLTASVPPCLAARAGFRMSLMFGVSLVITGMRDVLLAPAHHHLDIFGHLADRRAHAALAHAVRAAEIELDPVRLGLLDQRQDRLPAVLVARHHDRDHQRPVRPVLLDLLDLLQVHLQRPVGDQFDVVEAEQPPVRAPDRAVARPVDIDHRRAFLAQRLPHHAAPAGLEGALDIVRLVGRRRRRQPERIGRPDPDEVVADVSHLCPPGWRFVEMRLYWWRGWGRYDDER